MSVEKAKEILTNAANVADIKTNDNFTVQEYFQTEICNALDALEAENVREVVRQKHFDGLVRKNSYVFGVSPVSTRILMFSVDELLIAACNSQGFAENLENLSFAELHLLQQYLKENNCDFEDLKADLFLAIGRISKIQDNIENLNRLGDK
ncbi:hypothetical protein [Macrococcus bovicus]|uniref:Uncharacterized protein n=1 Tax=Macrococcus bovicus TaxID=69968 RepID=A0A4R6C2W8_9STAP|nr:hypothetical protein [Macrococcus bovicus]TDM15618.1 hypothetical protein ERX55_01555 [Macrococcus bovicus]